MQIKIIENNFTVKLYNKIFINRHTFKLKVLIDANSFMQIKHKNVSLRI